MNLTAALLWLLFNIIALAFSAFYSMMEMACVSFNNVRLQYYVNKGIKQAVWLNALLQNPSRLFGTTLIGVNLTNVISSECAREMYSSLGLPPDLAPLTQVAMVVILGELAPMFAARRYSENVVMLGMPALYLSAKLMEPFLWVIKGISLVCQLLIGSKGRGDSLFLTQEELVKILEDQDEERVHDEFTDIASNIFKLRHLNASDILEPLSHCKLLPSNATVKEMREAMLRSPSPFYLIYHRTISNIVSIAYPRDMIRASDNKRVRDFSKSPWFITLRSPIMEVLQQFQRNRQSVALVINDSGSAIGVITLDRLMDAVISSQEGGEESPKEMEESTQVIIDKTLPGDMTVSEFNQKFRVEIDKRGEMTLSELVTELFGHHPEVDDSVYIEPYQFTVTDTTLTEVKEISVSTKIK